MTAFSPAMSLPIGGVLRRMLDDGDVEVGQRVVHVLVQAAVVHELVHEPRDELRRERYYEALE